MVHTDRFKLAQLKLDQVNYRLGKTTTQRETLRAMIADQKNKLVNHANDLVRMGLSPGEFIWVTPDPKEVGVYTVLEGNRRVAALKILETPALADGTPYEKSFRALARDYKNPIGEIEARVFGDREEAKPWIRRRHMSAGSGVGLQPWKPLAKGRAMRDEGEGAPRSLAVVELLDDGTDAWAEVEAALEDRWTTVDRVLNAGSFRSVLGVRIDPKTSAVSFENGDHGAGKALLLRVLSVMASPQFKFASIEDKDDREQFVKGFEDWSVKKISKQETAIARDTAKSSAGSAGSPAKHGRATKDSKSRETLAPRSGSRMLHVENARLNGLYRECRNLRVKDNENAAAFLLRVFIELSSEALLVAENVTIPNRLQKEGKNQWGDIGIPLATKVGCVADHLDPSKKSKEFQQARLAAQASSRSPYSINTLHGYFHNLKFIPEASELKGAWDSWEAYLHAVHNALSPPA